jgi:adenosylcobinamide amidohydrolase
MVCTDRHTLVSPQTLSAERGDGHRSHAGGSPAVARFGPWLVVRLRETHAVASWAVVGGGLRDARTIVWRQVSETELRPPVDAAQWLRARMREAGLREAVGLMTSRRLDAWVQNQSIAGAVRAFCAATVGLGNALRAGDEPGPSARIGTINICCRVSVPLGVDGLLETLAIATEAKTAAVLESGVLSRRSAKAATGTGTDCVVVAAPKRRTTLRYAGKHTEVGAAVGDAVSGAVRAGVREWLREGGAS